ncbi:hypothetical protein M758_4G009700 [Ceratodon purpureus]|nr:hypothetical protein M758_4G009700 [Ceratodon purpureus]
MGSLGPGNSEEQVTDIYDGGLHNLADRLHGRILENINTCFVKPSTATPTEKEWLPLCNFDYLWMTYYTPLICTFTLTDQIHHFGSASGAVQHLKDSLAEALVLFYPLAGRVLTKDGPPRIHCSDAGAVFTEASIDADMAELRTDDFLPLPLLSGLVAAGLGDYPVLPEMPAGLPALIIQVTHFKCGGIALAANWSHGAADGHSGLHFMKSWSELARGAQVSLLPDHRRDLVKPRDPPVPTELVKAVAVSPDAQVTASKTVAGKDQVIKISVENSPVPMSKADILGSTLEARTEAKLTRVTTKILEFTKDEISQMRKAATDHCNPSTHFTRADCMFTHLWRTIVRSRNLPSTARVRLWILVEGRKKLSLPVGYFGNVIGRIPVITTVNELLNGPFSETAALIHSGIASITTEWFQGFVDWVQTREPGQYQLAAEELGPGADCSISHLVWFPFYDLDFGFGTPTCSMPNALHAPSHADVGSAFVSPSSHGADRMVVMTNLESRAVRRFISMAHDIPAAQ